MNCIVRGANRRIWVGVPVLAVLLLTLSCKGTSLSSDVGESEREPPGITLSILNGQPAAPLELVAGQEYVFDRITLQVENRNVRDSREALDWLRSQSGFRVLNWEGVREARAYWRNYKASNPSADVFAHVFEGAAWMSEGNSLEVSAVDAQGALLGTPLRLSNREFLNQHKQWDFDMIRAEYRYEDFARHKERSSAKVRRAVAKIVFAIQTNRSQRLRLPAQAQALRLVWDKAPTQPYDIPIRWPPSPYGYGFQIQIQVEPEKELYMPGETLRARITALDGSGQVLKIADYAKNGITLLNPHLEGPRHNPTFYHEEWLNDFQGRRFAYIRRAPLPDAAQTGESLNTPLEGPPLDSTGAHLDVELHIPADLPKEAYGTFEISATSRRSYASQFSSIRPAKPIQVGQREETEFERFVCKTCHTPGTPLDVGLLMPPMAGTTPLNVDRFQECVMCHDNSRGGTRRLDKWLHLIHRNRDNYSAPQNDCTACHMTSGSIQKVSMEGCSHCHENLHDNNQPHYTDAQCRDCHADDGRGHIVP
ncbi:MAG: hypothetical protein HY647_10930 [Acidobacteria bacterium]|nr:hypothetical protein [Acidobacteriota bacterium]